MTNKLKRLIPLHQVRERRSLRELHLAQEAETAAANVQMQTELEQAGLISQGEEERSRVLQGTSFSSWEAQAHLACAADSLASAQRMDNRIKELETQARQARDATVNARGLYAAEVRGTEKVQRAETAVSRRATLGADRSVEVEQDDEFLLVWSMMGAGKRMT